MFPNHAERINCLSFRSPLGGFEYKTFPWDALFKPSYGMTILRGKEFDKMPPIRSDDPKWIPSAIEPEWESDSKPARVARHVAAWHVALPRTVTAEHVQSYKDWAEAETSEDARRTRFAALPKFTWPLPKPCPPSDPTAPRIYVRRERPQEDIDREANETENVTHGGDDSQYRAAQGRADKRAKKKDADATSAAHSEGNNKIVVDQFYFIHWTEDSAPDELLFTLVKAKQVRPRLCRALFVDG